MGLTADQVTACLVTRGDVDMQPIVESLIFGHVIVWDNSKRENAYAYGRYLAAQEAPTDVVFFQDDDTILDETQQLELLDLYEPGVYLCNQAAGHQPGQFAELAFCAWGALTERRLFEEAFDRWRAAGHDTDDMWFRLPGCDIVFSLLTPKTRHVDVGQTHLPYAHGPNRLYRQAEYAEKKAWFYNAAMELRCSS